MSDIKQRISENRKDVQARVERVRNDAYLSDEGKRQRWREVYEKGMERHNALVEQHIAQQHSDLERMHGGLFAPRFKITEAANERSNIKAEFRRNLTEADDILEDRGVEGLQRYLERAQLSGDGHAARAAFAVAHSRGYEPVVEAYLDAYPDERERYDSYTQLDKETRNPDPHQQFARSFDLAPPPRPPEVPDYEKEPELAYSDHVYRGLGELHG